MNKKLIYAISNVDKSVLFESTVEGLNIHFDLKVILLNSGNTDFESFLKKNSINYNFILYRNKKDIPAATYKIYCVIKRFKPSIVHTHFLDANLAGLVAAKLAGIKQIIYTRHHSTEHHVYAPKGVYLDKLSNFLATDIVAISEPVKGVLASLEGVPEKKIKIIHHGYNFNEFANISPHRIQAIKNKYNLTSNHPVIGVISRYVHWKGIQYIIPAYKKLLAQYPNAVLILANANGDYKTEIQDLLADIPPSNYREIPFEKDMHALFRVFDVFVHVPINKLAEAFGLIYIEALASSIPSVFTLSGVANEFIKHNHNALVVDYANADDIFKSVIQILDRPVESEDMIMQGKADVHNLFNLNLYLENLKQLYYK